MQGVEGKVSLSKMDGETVDMAGKTDLAKNDAPRARLAYFEFHRKNTRVNMRMPRDLLMAVKREAKRHGVPYQRYIREILERALKDSAAQTQSATGR